MSWTPGPLASRGTASARRCNASRSSPSRGPAPASGPVAAVGSRTASASGCTPRRISRPDQSPPTPRSCRTNLASVILQMTSLGLGDIASFPFLDPPDSRQIADGVKLLEELQAIEPATDRAADPRKRLTAYGRKIAQLPLDPRLARMVLEAGGNGALREVLIIVAALSIQDPREGAMDKRQQADERLRLFAYVLCYFVTFLSLWNSLKQRQRYLSVSAFRRMCKSEYLHYLR